MSRGTVSGNGIVTNGLVLALDAANPRSYISGSTVWRDLTVNGNNGTLTNGPAFNSVNGGSIFFDGIDDYVDGNNINLRTEISAFVVVKPQQKSGTNYPFYIGKWSYNGGVNNRSWAIGSITSNNIDYFAVSSDGTYNSNAVKRYDLPITYDTWYQLGFTFNNGILIPYKNGIIANYSINLDANINTIHTSNVSYSIGYAIDGILDFYYKGSIASVQIYNRALSASEILQNYNATKTRFGL